MAQAHDETFVMHGAREAVAAGMTHVEQQVIALERSVSENPALAFDLARTIVESTCKKILSDRKIPFENDADLPKLFKMVTQRLPMLPVGASNESEVRRSLSQTVNGLHTSLQGVCELRNACGFASHGSGAQRPALEAVQAMLVAQTADAIVGFLHRLHRGERPSAERQPGRTKTVDMVIDVNYEPVAIAGQPYAVSEALYGTDPEAYLDIAAVVEESRNVLNSLAETYPNSLRPDIEQVSFVHFNDTVYLKVLNRNGELILEDTGFVYGEEEGQLFLPSRSPDQNGELFVTSFDSLLIINCFDLFTEEAASRIAEKHNKGVRNSLFPSAGARNEVKT